MKRIDVKLNNISDKKGILQQLLSEAARYKPLTPEQEKTATVDELIKHNMLFACSVAFRHYHKSIDIMDLVSESLIGLIKAAECYDRNSGNKFISYAVWKMRAEIMNFINNKGDTVRIPQNVQFVRQKIDLSKYIDISDYELAEIYNVTEGMIKNIRSLGTTVSLDETFEDGENIYEPAGYFFADTDTLTNEDVKISKRLLDILDEREQKIIFYRHLDIIVHDYTKIGKMFNLSSERIKFIELRALKKMRNYYDKTITKKEYQGTTY